MPQEASVHEAIAANYAGLSGKLRVAADHLVDNPFDIATRSLRSVAAASGVSPPTLSRLALALGYESYEAMREASRADLERPTVTFSSKARQLQSEAEIKGMAPLLRRHSAACVANIETMVSGLDEARFAAAVDCVATANRVVMVAALGSAGLGEHLAYITSWFSERWVVVGRSGVSFGAAMARLQPDDAVIVLSKAPYARLAVRACETAADSESSLIAITDSHVFPGLVHAQHRFVVPSDGPTFFPSYTATLVLLETMIGMLVARAGPQAEARISAVARQNHSLEEFWAP